MTDITELAQREKFEAWAMTKICISKSTLEGLRTSDGYRNSTLSGRDYNLMWNLWKAAGAELVEALEKAQQRITQMESRTVTVKLPDIMPPEAAPAHYWGSGESMAYADGYNKSAADLKTSFALSCSSAGVNVEFE